MQLLELWPLANRCPSSKNMLNFDVLGWKDSVCATNLTLAHGQLEVGS